MPKLLGHFQFGEGWVRWWWWC